MSTNLRLRVPMLSRNAAVGLMVTLGLAVTLALGGCAAAKKEQPAPGAKTAAAAAPEVQTCEQQHNQAVLECQQTWDPMSSTTTNQLAACQAQALQAYQACRDQGTK